MTRFVGLDVSQKLTSICIVDETGRRLWRGQCTTDPEQIECAVRGHAEDDVHIGLETGPNRAVRSRARSWPIPMRCPRLNRHSPRVCWRRSLGLQTASRSQNG